MIYFLFHLSFVSANLEVIKSLTAMAFLVGDGLSGSGVSSSKCSSALCVHMFYFQGSNHLAESIQERLCSPDLCEFKASPVYSVKSRIAKGSQRNSVSKNKSMKSVLVNINSQLFLTQYNYLDSIVLYSL
jgi:hypothetical protein